MKGLVKVSMPQQCLVLYTPYEYIVPVLSMYAWFNVNVYSKSMMYTHVCRRRVWRYQSNQKPYIEEEQTTQCRNGSMFVWLWVLTFPLEDCSEFGNFVITLIDTMTKVPVFFNSVIMCTQILSEIGAY